MRKICSENRDHYISQAALAERMGVDRAMSAGWSWGSEIQQS
jgi:hypothetical protein